MSPEWLETCSLSRFLAEIDVTWQLARRGKPKVVKVKPYINLDMGAVLAPRMARLALRAYRPFDTAENDPCRIRDDADAIGQLEEFVQSPTCPRWLQARYATHNRVSRRKRQRGPEDGGRPRKHEKRADTEAGTQDAAKQDAAGNVIDDTEPAAAFRLQSRTSVAKQHCMRWHDEGTYPDQAFSVHYVVNKACVRSVPTAYLKSMLEALREGAAVPREKLARMETLVHYVLQLDLESFHPYKSSCVKPSLPTKALRAAADKFRQYHPMMKKEELEKLQSKLPYAVLWYELKRAVLKECGLDVLDAPSRRIYFEDSLSSSSAFSPSSPS